MMWMCWTFPRQEITRLLFGGNNLSRQDGKSSADVGIKPSQKTDKTACPFKHRGFETLLTELLLGLKPRAGHHDTAYKRLLILIIRTNGVIFKCWHFGCTSCMLGILPPFS